MTWNGRWCDPMSSNRSVQFSSKVIPALLFSFAMLVAVPFAAAQDECEELEDLDPVEIPEDDVGTPADEPIQPPVSDTADEPPTGEPDDEPVRRESAFAPQTGSTESPEYQLRLQELEDRVNDLKEQIFRSRSRLVLLRERVLGTRIGGSQAIIKHVNDMSATFTLEQVIYSLDGNQLYSATNDDGELDDRDEMEVYNGTILPGPHNVSVEMIFVGNGYGLFSYLEGYRVRTRSSYAFTAEDGKVAELNIIAFEDGGINQPIEERASIRYELSFVDAVAVEE